MFLIQLQREKNLMHLSQDLCSIHICRRSLVHSQNQIFGAGYSQDFTHSLTLSFPLIKALINLTTSWETFQFNLLVPSFINQGIEDIWFDHNHLTMYFIYTATRLTVDDNVLIKFLICALTSNVWNLTGNHDMPSSLPADDRHNKFYMEKFQHWLIDLTGQSKVRSEKMKH